MDRALDREHIRLALGDQQGLPSPSELVELIAEAEVALFHQEERVDPRLQDVAWYLHSVASALPAFELYGADRQRAAFQVSGHLLDLILTNPDLSPDERLRCVFAAQVSYLRGGLDPNAIAVYRSRLQLPEHGSFEDPTLALRLGSSLLAFDTRWLFPELSRVSRQRDDASVSWGVHPVTTVFGSASLLIDGTRHLLYYLVYGSQTELESAQVALARAVHNDASLEDLDSRWVAFHLLQLGEHFGKTSLWAVLPPDTSEGVVRAFTMASPPILSLWPPQAELLGQDDPNPFDPGVRRMVLSVPTSAGKTLLAQVLVADHLARADTGVCFVAPTRSLCREIQGSLRRRLRNLTRAAEVSQSDLIFGTSADGTSTVEVMTPERLAYLMRVDPAQVLSRFGLFVIDEAHTLTDGARGWTLEWVLSTIHHLTLTRPHRIVVMSAALGQRGNLVTWLDPSGTGVDFHSDWRGPRRVHAIYTTEPDWDHPRDLPKLQANSPERREYDLHGVLRLRPTGAGRIHALSTTAPIGKLILRPKAIKDKVDPESTRFYKALVPLVSILGRAGPVLIIEATKVEASRLAREIANVETARAGPIWLIDLATARLGDQHPLIACLRHGVAYHHASLPSDIQVGIEEAIATGDLGFVVATTTLTEGVNLPVRTVVIASQGAHLEGGYREFITGARLLNAIGRAGRAARESEGWVVLARQAEFNRTDFDRLKPTEADMPVQSVMVTALNELAELEAMQARGVDISLARPGEIAEGFLSYVWYVASVLEESGLSATPDEVDEFLKSTLAWIQLPDADRERWRGIASAAAAAYNAKSATVRRRWGRAGIALPAAALLEEIAKEVVAEVVRDGNNDSVDPTPLLCRTDRLARILALPESQAKPIRTRRGGRPQLVTIDEAVILTDWMGGLAIADLAEKHLSEVSDQEYRFEQLADHLTAAYENFLPWAFGMLIEWANMMLADGSDEAPRLDGSLPAFVRYGVNSVEAVQLVRAGIPSRALATQLVAAYNADQADPEKSLRGWLCTLDVAEWRIRFHPSPGELRALLEFASTAETRLAASLLGGQTLRLPVRLLGSLAGEAIAEIRPLPDEDAGLGVWVGDILVAGILPEHLAETQAVLATGIPVSVMVRPVGDGAEVSIWLVNPFE